MASKGEKQALVEEEEQQQQQEVFIPLSPMSQCLNSSTMSLTVISVLEFEIPIDEHKITEIANNVLLPSNIRFQSIIDTNKKDKVRWKKVEVRVEDHIIVPTFPIGLSRAEYEEHLRAYLSKIAGEQFSEDQPLWEFHVIKYPTLTGVSSAVFKFSHAIGDGYSLVGVLSNGLQRADNPSLPLTFPAMSLRLNEGMGSFCRGFFSKLSNTVFDLTFNFLRGTVLEDSTSAIRSGKPGVEFEPMDISSINVSLELIKQVQSKVGGTVNDVIIGLIYYMIHLYSLRTKQISSATRMTLQVMFNKRMLKGYKNIDEMVKANIWGNQVSCVYTSMPSYTHIEEVDPLHFMFKAKEDMKRNKNSMSIFLHDAILTTYRCITGQKGFAQFVYKSFKNTSSLISNLIGPKEKMKLANCPVSGFYFIVTGIPQSLRFTVVSYMGQLKLVTTMQKEFINSRIFTSCMNEAFEKTFEAASKKEN